MRIKFIYIIIFLVIIALLGKYGYRHYQYKRAEKIIEQEEVIPIGLYYQQTEGVKDFCRKYSYELQRYPQTYKERFSSQYKIIFNRYKDRYGIDYHYILQEYSKKYGESITKSMEAEFSKIRNFLLHNMVRVNVNTEEDKGWNPEFDTILGYKEICEELDHSTGKERFFVLFENELNSYIELSKN